MSWLLSHSLSLPLWCTGEAVGRVGSVSAVYGMPVQSSRSQTPRSLGLSRSIPGQANGWLVPTHTPGSLDPQPRFNH